MMHRSRGLDSSMAHEAFTVPGATQGVICPLATQMATAVNEPYSEDKSVDTRRVRRSTRCTPESAARISLVFERQWSASQIVVAGTSPLAQPSPHVGICLRPGPS